MCSQAWVGGWIILQPLMYACAECVPNSLSRSLSYALWRSRPLYSPRYSPCYSPCYSPWKAEFAHLLPAQHHEYLCIMLEATLPQGLALALNAGQLFVLKQCCVVHQVWARHHPHPWNCFVVLKQF